jgi:hypothetical protein
MQHKLTTQVNLSALIIMGKIPTGSTVSHGAPFYWNPLSALSGGCPYSFAVLLVASQRL